MMPPSQELPTPAVHAGAGGADAGADLGEGPGIEQEVDPLPGGQLAPAVLSLDVLRAAADEVLLLDLVKPPQGCFHSRGHELSSVARARRA
jgi:hypothetical protein